MSISKTLSTVGRFLKKNAPTFLSVAAAIGVVSTAYLTAKATPKAASEKKTIDKIRDYALPGAVGAVTIACIVASDRIHVSREAGLILSYNALAHGVNRERVKELATTATGAAAYKIAEGAEGKTLNEEEKWFFDDFASSRLGRGVFYKTTWKNVLMSNLHVQDEYLINGYASAKEYYKELNKQANSPDITELVRQLGDDLGWDCDHLISDYDCVVGVPFEYGNDDLLTPDGEPCSGIYFSIIPEFEEF